MTTISTRSKKKLNLHIFSQNESAIAVVETTIPRAANTRTKCVTNVKRKATWLKYVKERRNLQSKTSVGAGRIANKERILLKKTGADQDDAYAIHHLPTIEKNRSKWIWNFVVQVKYESQQKKLNALIVKGGGPNLLGRDWLEEIRLDWETIFQIASDNPRSALHEMLSKYQDVFTEGLCTPNGVKAKIYVDQGAEPKYIKARAVPYALSSNVELELERMEREGIISPVNSQNGRRPLYLWDLL